jgi:hypothetical protein
MGFLLGLDLGQTDAYSAVAIAACHDNAPRGTGIYQIQWLWRFELGTSYPEVVRLVAYILANKIPQGSQKTLVIDGTGVGRAVTDLFVDAGLDPIPITLHGGKAVTRDERYWRCPRQDVLVALEVAVLYDRLHVAGELTYAPALAEELRDLRRTQDPTRATESYTSWREKARDDLTFATALCVWWGEFRAAGHMPVLDLSRMRVPKIGGIRLGADRVWADDWEGETRGGSHGRGRLTWGENVS